MELRSGLEGVAFIRQGDLVTIRLATYGKIDTDAINAKMAISIRFPDFVRLATGIIRAEVRGEEV